MIPSTPPSSRPSPKGAEPGPRPIYPHPDHWVPDRFASGMTGCGSCPLEPVKSYRVVGADDVEGLSVVIPVLQPRLIRPILPVW